LDGQATPAEFFNLIGQRICLFLGDPEIDRDVCAGSGQRKRYGSPNATTGTGNQGNFADKLCGLHGSKNTLDLANRSNQGGEIPIDEESLPDRPFFCFIEHLWKLATFTPRPATAQINPLRKIKGVDQ
jgi:hypothetical protein